MVSLPKASELARIQSGTGEDYPLTSNDAEWTLRMAVFEGGGDPAPILWTMAQRFALLRSQGKGYKTFASLLRDFSQPINPKWLRTGDFCRPGGKYADTLACSEDKLARREQAQRGSLEGILQRVPETAERVNAWLRGELPNPVPRATNFAQEPVAESFLERNPDAQVLLRIPASSCPACNVILVTTETERWPKDMVWLRASDGAIASARGAGSPKNRFAQGFVQGLSRWWRFT